MVSQPTTLSTPVSTPDASSGDFNKDSHIQTHSDKAAKDLPLRVIEASPGWKIVDFAELWRFRELLLFMIWRDIIVRYKQTILGIAWAIIQPLTQMIVFSIFFGRMAEVSHGSIKYPLFAFTGLLAWTFFSNSVTTAAGSVVASQNLITKVYFPRLFIPASAIGVGLADLAIAFLLLPPLMYLYQGYPGSTVIMLPVIIGGLTLAAFGIGTLIAALTVAYRDFRHVVPFMVQIWMFATPTVYMDATPFGPRWQTYLPLNPLYGLIQNFRYALLGKDLNYYSLEVSLGSTLVLLILGCLYFRRVERSFADVI